MPMPEQTHGSVTTLRGVPHIAALFAQARAEQRAVFMPYLVVGHPDRETFYQFVVELERAGAEMFELGVPFSDPLADGPVIQAATQQALTQGINVAACLAGVRELRARGVQAVLNFMSYVNPLLAYDVSRFCADAAAAGLDGLIVPDLPPEENDELAAACQVHGLALVRFLAPTSTPARVARVTREAEGFIYLVSLTGVTGIRDRLPPELEAFVTRVRAETSVPLAVGFGISNAEQARTVAQIADGVIVGTAIVKRAGGENPVPEVVALGRELAAACRRWEEGERSRE
jgi:tryptophan synthase alpha chain